MKLDRVAHGSPYSTSPKVLRDVVFDGLRANRSGMMCLAIREPGKPRATLIEVGQVREIVAQGRVLTPPTIERWQASVERIGTFLTAEAQLDAASACSEPLETPKRSSLLRRLFGRT